MRAVLVELDRTRIFYFNFSQLNLRKNKIKRSSRQFETDRLKENEIKEKFEATIGERFNALPTANGSKRRRYMGTV